MNSEIWFRTKVQGIFPVPSKEGEWINKKMRERTRIWSDGILENKFKIFGWWIWKDIEFVLIKGYTRIIRMIQHKENLEKLVKEKKGEEMEVYLIRD